MFVLILYTLYAKTLLRHELKEKQSLVPFEHLPTFAGKQGDRICPLQSWAD